MGAKQVEIFQETIQSQLLGPGSDIYLDDSTYEIISDYPLKRYYSGILFPERVLSSQGESDTEEFDSDSDDELIYENEDEDDIDDQLVDESNTPSKDINKDTKDQISLSNHFFPSDMGISFCLDSNIQSIEAKFNFAVYKQPKQTEIKYKISNNTYQILMGDKYGFPFKDNINFEKIDEHYGYLSLIKKLKGKKIGRTGDYSIFDEWRNTSDPDIKEIVMSAYSEFDKLITKTWQRAPVEISRTIFLSDNILVPEPFSDYKNAGYTLKFYILNNRKYIKIQLVNLAKGITNDQFTNTKELLNESSLFQAQIVITANNFLPYKPFDSTKKYKDKEYQKLEFLFRETEHFSIGHNCSAEWSPFQSPTQVNSTFIPKYDLKATKTDVSEMNNIPLYDMSIWGKNQNDVIDLLSKFVLEYSNWIKSQTEEKDANSQVGSQVILELEKTLERLNESLLLLASNEELFRAFQFANTAMLIQFSLDDSFYKEVQNTSLDKSIPNLSESQKNSSYRPFQLAFLLISIESVINTNSKYRNESVDLIWFPTGGGKTEAYLAVAALTILWRRMSYTDYSGVSVIMRYTLRLLTAQQFERASKLITVLEYLRQQFTSELKKDVISIGLWIGGDSTPNNLKSAINGIKSIDKNGESANQFQLDKCSWCGSKLIVDNKGIYSHAFHVRERKREFLIKCLNEDCHFHNKKGLPIQVVDEVLYIDPPTLLFATVDKFAMLSWVEDGHIFFNSLNKKGTLPPDLIIQDELHLLSGPLGSIVGLFEAIVEDLCTKDGVSPKIIASTATTRNTDHQIKQLYGNRSVSIFPPPGLTHKDSFFCKTI